MLIVGAGVQGLAHLDALVAYAQDRRLHAQRVDDPNTALGQCTYVVTTTTASEPVMREVPAAGSFVAAVEHISVRHAWHGHVCITFTSPVTRGAGVHEASIHAVLDVADEHTIFDEHVALRGVTLVVDVQ